MPSAVAGVPGQLRQIRFADQVEDTPYRLIRRQRQHIGLRVNAEGLVVIAAPLVPLTAIEAALMANQAWILQQLHQHQTTAPLPELLVRDGLEFPLLGQTCRLRILPSQQRRACQVVWQPDLRQLTLIAAPQLSAQALLKHFLRAVQTQALAILQQRLDLYGQKMGLLPLPPLSLTAAKTRWGSCSTRGIRLHWQLIHSSLELLDYVVVHELAHLREMNHSPKFWAIVAEFYPTWRKARLALRDIAGKLPRFTA